MSEKARLLDDREMFLWQQYGEAALGKQSYVLGATIAGAPLIRSKQTNRRFLIPWEVMIGMAVKAGIDQPARPLPSKKGKRRRG